MYGFLHLHQRGNFLAYINDHDGQSGMFIGELFVEKRFFQPPGFLDLSTDRIAVGSFLKTLLWNTYRYTGRVAGGVRFGKVDKPQWIGYETLSFSKQAADGCTAF